MDGRKTLNVKISGREYALMTDEAHDVFADAVRRVDESMSTVLGPDGRRDKVDAAVLTALRFALEVIKGEACEASREKKLRELISLLS